MITVYHGGVERIEKPLAKVGRKNLDLGLYLLADNCIVEDIITELRG